jgi:hypothetical protein
MLAGSMDITGQPGTGGRRRTALPAAIITSAPRAAAENCNTPRETENLSRS